MVIINSDISTSLYEKIRAQGVCFVCSVARLAAKGKILRDRKHVTGTKGWKIEMSDPRTETKEKRRKNVKLYICSYLQRQCIQISAR
jgi:hypothetical protein